MEFKTQIRSLSLIVLTLNFSPRPAAAIPSNTLLFCQTYPASSLCSNGRTDCALCHAPPPQLNPFGRSLAGALSQYPDFDRSEESFAAYLKPSLSGIENLDSDSDGVSNGAEIALGQPPGVAAGGTDDGQRYDAELARRRIELLFCGRSPDWTEASVRVPSRETLHARLDACLASDFWKKTALPRLADEKIRPNRAIGREGDPFVIGDYDYDYRLFVSIVSEGRDLRELLTATYHIDPSGQRVEGPIRDQNIPGKSVIGNGQPLEVSRRYGMITTQWFISLNTMFAELPRNTASQAYRAYLGLDIARSEGLFPIENEPRDVDHKGVGQAACAACHSTLDPLAYAFAPYVGLRSRRLPVGSYDPSLIAWESWGSLFGEPVADLGQWVARAVGSEAYQQNIARLFFRYAIGHLPQSAQEERDFERLWRRLPELGYTAPALIHELIDSLSFGGRPSPLIWKRARILEQDLGRALALEPAVLCQELGQFSCFDQVHLAALGGNDPFGRAQYTPISEPSTLSAIALERVILKACSTRAARDSEFGQAEVFRFYPPSLPLSQVDRAALKEQIQELYRRFHSRDPKVEETSSWLALAADFDRSAAGAFNEALCLGIGSQLEFLFF